MMLKGFKAMIPVSVGVLPFGLVMGTVSFAAGLNILQTASMNLLVFAGSAQLAAIDLMLQKTSGLVVVATGLIINLRFMLYSAALAPYLEKSSFWTKVFCSYNITDQNFSVMKANESLFPSNFEAIQFYCGASLCMFVAWQFSVMIGFLFGNILPASLALDYAIPLSFVALVMPTLKNKKYFYVLIASSIFSVLLKSLPFNLGLLASTLLALAFAAFLTRKRTTP